MENVFFNRQWGTIVKQTRWRKKKPIFLYNQNVLNVLEFIWDISYCVAGILFLAFDGLTGVADSVHLCIAAEMQNHI